MIEVDEASFDGELAAFAHRIAAVDREIDERGLELRRVDFNDCVFRRQHQLQLYGLADRPGDERQHVPDEIIDPHLLRLYSRLAREAQELARQLGALFRRLGGLEQALAGLAIAVDGMFDQIEIAQYDGEQVVEVMRQPAGELADGFHLLRLLQLALGLAAAGGVDDLHYKVIDFALFAANERDAGERPYLGLLVP